MGQYSQQVWTTARKRLMTPGTREGQWQDVLWIQRRESFRTVIHWRHWAGRPQWLPSSMPTPKEAWGFIWSQPHHCPGETLHQPVTAQELLGIDLTSWVVLQVRFPHPILACSNVTPTNRLPHYLCQKKFPINSISSPWTVFSTVLLSWPNLLLHI